VLGIIQSNRDVIILIIDNIIRIYGGDRGIMYNNYIGHIRHVRNYFFCLYFFHLKYLI
jgi:hypothetical protein